MPSYRASTIVDDFFAAVEREVDIAVRHGVLDRVRLRIAILQALARLVHRRRVGMPPRRLLRRHPLGPRRCWFPPRPAEDGLVIDPHLHKTEDETYPPGFCPVHGWWCPDAADLAHAPAIELLPSPTPVAEAEIPRWRPPTPAPPGFCTLAARRSTSRSFLTADVAEPSVAAVPFLVPHLFVQTQDVAAETARLGLHLPNGVDPALNGRRPSSGSFSSSVEEADSIS